MISLQQSRNALALHRISYGTVSMSGLELKSPVTMVARTLNLGPSRKEEEDGEPAKEQGEREMEHTRKRVETVGKEKRRWKKRDREEDEGEKETWKGRMRVCGVCG